MIHSIRFTCVLDTNVIIPIEIRDLLFWFAHDDLYTPKWSKHIFDEWEDVMRRKNVSKEEIKKRIGWANLAFPDAMVEWFDQYSKLFTRINLEKRKLMRTKHKMFIAPMWGYAIYARPLGTSNALAYFNSLYSNSY